MTDPFEDDQLRVLVNDEGQHSLWPAAADAPAGWRPAFGPADRAACSRYVSTQWTDIRPGSVASRLGSPPVERR